MSEKKEDGEEISESKPIGQKESVKENTSEQTVTKKPRKEFVWTEKRLDAFGKMREGLATKVEITKQIKEEKKVKEKEEIKRRVKEIMEQTTLSSSSSRAISSGESDIKSTKKDKKVNKSSSSNVCVSKDETESDPEFSESEEEVEQKQPQKGKKVKPSAKKQEEKEEKKSRKQKPKRKQVVVESSQSESSEQSSSEEENETDFVHNQRQSSYSHKQLKNHSKDRVEGKSARRAQFVNPMDRFILL